MIDAAMPHMGGVRVKPLEWTGRNADGSIHIAHAVPMQYWAWELAGYGYWSWGTLTGREVHGGIEAAKAAAQADYERRILSALASHEPARVRTVTRQEIIPGTYDGVCVRPLPGRKVDVSLEGCVYNADQLDRAAAVLTALAGALRDGE